MKKKKLELRLNNCHSSEPCTFCGHIANPDIPLAVFQEGTHNAVCPDCVEKYAPELNRILYAVYSEQDKLRREVVELEIMLNNIHNVLKPHIQKQNDSLPF